MKTILLAGFIALLSIPVAGCVGHHDPHITHAENAVMCDKCKVTFELIGSHTVRHEYIKVMLCPDCEQGAAHFFKTGQLKHHCGHCGGTMICYEK